MQLIRHEIQTSESELAEKISFLISAGHCIERIDRRAIDVSTYTYTDKEFVNVYTIESLTVATKAKAGE